MKIPLRVTAKQLDEILLTLGVFTLTSDYAKDHHFERHVIRPNIKNYRAARRFLLKLESECPNCVKARVARSYFKKPFWREGDRWAGGLAEVRRTHCRMHAVGSFACNEVTKGPGGCDWPGGVLDAKLPAEYAALREAYLHRKHQERVALVLQRHTNLVAGAL